MAAIEAGTVGNPMRLERWKRIALGTLKLFFDPDTAPRCAGTAFFGFLRSFPPIATVFLIYGLVADATLLVETIDTCSTCCPRWRSTSSREQLVDARRTSPTPPSASVS